MNDVTKTDTDRREGGTTIAAIERAADVLLFMAKSSGSTVGVTEIASSLGMSKAVVHRILTSLRNSGFVGFDPDSRRYKLGPSNLTVGAAYLDTLDIRDLAQGPMDRLVEVLQETATLSIRQGWTRTYVDQVTPDREVRMSVRLGVPFPLHAGASSKAFLAFMETEFVEEYLARDPLDALTPATIVSPDDLRKELEEIRARGFAASLGERQTGAASVAAPVLDRKGHPVAVLSVAGPVERFRDRMDEAATQLLRETHELSHLMGSPR